MKDKKCPECGVNCFYDEDDGVWYSEEGLGDQVHDFKDCDDPHVDSLNHPISCCCNYCTNYCNCSEPKKNEHGSCDVCQGEIEE